MEKAKLLGYWRTGEHNEADDNSDHPFGHIEDTFFIELNGKVFSFSATHRYGSCSSGWTSASWGDIAPQLVEVTKLPETLNVPKKPTYVNTHEGNVFLKYHESEYGYDAMVEYVESTDGEEIVRATGDGGCQYYSSGVATTNDALFESTPQKYDIGDDNEEHYGLGGGIGNFNYSIGGL